MQVVCKPNTIKPYKKFEGEIYALKKDEGGRHTPFFSNYKPQFFFRTADITGDPFPCMGIYRQSPKDSSLTFGSQVILSSLLRRPRTICMQSCEIPRGTQV